MTPGGRFYGTPLAGDRLVDGRYEPIPLERRADGSIWGYSAALDLYLCWDRRNLYFWDPKAGRFLHNIGRADAARQAAEAELTVARNDLSDTQDALAAARAGEREARELLAGAEETIRRLREWLGDAAGEAEGGSSESDAGGAAGAGQED